MATTAGFSSVAFHLACREELPHAHADSLRIECPACSFSGRSICR